MVDIVSKLISKLQSKGHVVIADRGFGSIDLAEALKKDGQYCVLSCKYDKYLYQKEYFIKLYMLLDLIVLQKFSLVVLIYKLKNLVIMQQCKEFYPMV